MLLVCIAIQDVVAEKPNCYDLVAVLFVPRDVIQIW